MKVLLIFPPTRMNDLPRNFPTGLGIIAAILRQEGHAVTVLDINGNRFSKEYVEKFIAKEKFDIVGIGGLLTVYNYVKWLVPIIKKKNPQIPVVLGGSIGSNVPELSLTKLKVDYVVDGEGEITAPKLFKALENKDDVEHIKGIWFLKNAVPYCTGPCERVSDLDEVPWPAWDLFPMKKYLQNPVVGFGKDLDLITSRGCPYQCIFCYKIGGRYYRQMSIKKVISEIKNLIEIYKLDFISFQDNEFMIDKNWVKEFCHKPNEENINIQWSCTGRVNLVDEEIVKTMKDAGCTSISFGIESGSQKMLDIMKKAVTAEQAKNAITLVKNIGLRCPCSFMIGLPGETKETIEETIQFCKDINMALTALMFAAPYPGTELFEMAKKAGKIPADWRDLEPLVSKLGDCVDFVVNLTDSFTDQELIQMRDYMIHETQKTHVPEPIEARKKKFIDLYGTEVYNKILDQLKDSKNVNHLLTHGFNDLFDFLKQENEKD